MENHINEGEIHQRHKQERKDLQSKIQSLKKSVAKGDKKKKKEIAEEIAQLERDLENKHAAELEATKTNEEKDDVDDLAPAEDTVEESQDAETEETPNQPRMSRASKRRLKKAQEEKEREKRIMEQAERNKEGPRVTEMNAIKEALKPLGLQLHNIPADGNCLYCAVNHQLDITGRESLNISKLRKLTAEFMREHKDDFLPFMYNDSDEGFSDEYFEQYCKEVANTKLWGGQLEIRALSSVLKCPIKVIQASGPPTLQGENFKGPELILAYHRHLYRLGEHYNSTIAAQEGDSQ